MAFTVGQLEIQLIADVARLRRDMDKMQGTVRKATNNVNRSVESSVKAFKGLIGVVGAAGLVRAVGRAVDSYTRFSAILKQSTKSQDEFNTALANVSKIAQRGQADISAIGLTYARFTNNLRDLGTAQSDISTLTETLTLALKVNGATTEESTSAMLQMSQAFGKGKLDGDEFRTTMEAMPNVMRVLAESMGVPFGALKDLAQQGAITSEVMLKAFTDPELLEAYRKNAKEVRTIGGAWQNLENRFVSVIGKINEATGASKALMGVLRGVEILLSAFEGGEKGSILRNFLDTGVAAQQKRYAGMTTSQLRNLALFESDAKKALEARLAVSANQVFSGESANGAIGPNFGSTVVAQDINKIHEKQEEEARLYKQLLDRKKELNEKAAREEEELQKFLYFEEIRLAEEAREWKQKQDEELNETRKKWIDLQQKRAIENFEEAQKANKEFEEERRREAEKTSDLIARSLTDALLRGFESGKSFAENFLDTLKNMFQTTVLQPIVKFLVDSSGITAVMGAITGAFSSTASASGGGSVSSVFDNIGNLFKTGNASIVSSIENLGVFLSTGNGGLGDILGGALGQYAGTIADVLPYAGAALQLLSGDVKGAAFTAAGTAIGSAIGGPIGGAIGGALGGAVGGLFGGDKPRTPIYGSAAHNYFQGGQLISSNNPAFGTKKHYQTLGADANLNSLSSSFATAINTLLSEFGTKTNIYTSSYVAQRKGTARAGFYSDFTGGNYSFDQGGDGTAAQRFAEMVEAVLSKGIQTVIKSSNIPKGIKKFFDGVMTKETVAGTINAIISVRNALGDLPDIFKAIQFELDTTKFKSSGAQLTARFQALQQYTNLFYTDAEKFDTVFKQLTTQFNAINQTLPSSRDEFRALVDGFEVFDKTSANTFYSLVALAPALDAYYQALEQQANGIDEVNRALADGLDRNLFSTYADYISGQANVLAGGSASGFMARMNNPVAMNQVMAEEIKMLRAENAETKVVLQQIAFNTKKTKDIQKEWNGDGLPTERTY